jgi:hypothetical protein
MGLGQVGCISDSIGAVLSEHLEHMLNIYIYTYICIYICVSCDAFESDVSGSLPRLVPPGSVWHG